jgi:hypothetical protein
MFAGVRVGRLCRVGKQKTTGDQATLRSTRKKVLPSNWSVIVLVLVAVVTAVWIGVLAFGLIHLIQHVF